LEKLKSVKRVNISIKTTFANCIFDVGATTLSVAFRSQEKGEEAASQPHNFSNPRISGQLFPFASCARTVQRSNFDSWVVGVDRSGGMKYFCRKVTTQLPNYPQDQLPPETNYPKQQLLENLAV
jgi:hypothetical protein